jgi:4,5-DOPA dioxygenase extradiol
MLPSLFISHGAAPILLSDEPVRRYFESVGARFRPPAILVVSAHFAREVPTLAIRDKSLLAMTSRALSQSAIAHETVTIDPRGDDLMHSAWLPLHLMFGESAAAVGLLSLRRAGSPSEHHALGRALSPLREQGVLVLGSGSLTHNIEEIFLDARPGAPVEWAHAFVSWIADRVELGDVDALADYRRRAPYAERCHPTEEHLLPLFVAMGAGSPARGRMSHDGFVFGSVSLGAFEFV